MVKLKDPYAQKGLTTIQKWVISILVVGVVALGLWLGNLLSWAGLDSPLKVFNKEQVEEVVSAEAAAEETAVVETAEPSAN